MLKRLIFLPTSFIIEQKCEFQQKLMGIDSNKKNPITTTVLCWAEWFHAKCKYGSVREEAAEQLIAPFWKKKKNVVGISGKVSYLGDFGRKCVFCIYLLFFPPSKVKNHRIGILEVKSIVDIFARKTTHDQTSNFWRHEAHQTYSWDFVKLAQAGADSCINS